VPISGKRLSYLLRHRPDAIGLELEERGFGCASVPELLRLLARGGEPKTRADLEALVRGVVGIPFIGLQAIEYRLVRAPGAAETARTRVLIEDLVRHADAWKEA